MGNPVIASPAFVDAATLTAGSEAAGMEVEYLQTDQPSERWRSAGLSNLYIEVDLGAAQAINALILHDHNLTSAATWRIRGATSQANLTAAPGYDTGATFISVWPATGRPVTAGAKGWAGPLFSMHWLLDGGPGAQTYRWWRIDLADAANPDGYVEAGRLIVDDAWQSSEAMEYDWSLTPLDDSPKERTEGGQIYPTPRPRSWRLAFTLSFLDEDEAYDNALAIAHGHGVSKPLFILRDPEATKHLHKQFVYGLVADLQPVTNRTLNDFSLPYVADLML